jgi:hypothetical protein
MMLRSEQQGLLVISSLGYLPGFVGDLLDEDIASATGCCPHGCCAACSVLLELDRDHKLDDAVMMAPPHVYHDMSWWGLTRVDRTWLYSCWSAEDEHRRGACGTLQETEQVLIDRLTDFWPLTNVEALRLIHARLAHEETLSGDAMNGGPTPL